ncbi:MAG TPA: class I adenylate-forming enzyme family protein [Acidimicrobiales bacterium]|jgi:acyl-CoA synthetase (AMP-forming)/AMP-acid ligase II|nr:class I adenylate-forming enzyme family protein [Acidimicrobiales bacterium]
MTAADDAIFPDYVPTAGNAVGDAARRWGDHDFVVTNQERLTYAELDLRSRHLACRLVEVGVSKGDKIAVLFPNGPAWAVSWAAVVRLGAVAVPVSTFYTESELGRFLNHADVRFVLGVSSFLHHDYAERLASIAPELGVKRRTQLLLPSMPQLRGVLFWDESPVSWATGGYGADLDDEPSAELAEQVAAMEGDVTPADPMMLLYTSGSTAEPKGVLHGHGAMTRHAVNLAAMSGWRDTYRLWTSMPFFWIGGFHNTLFRALVAGAMLVTQPVFDPTVALETLEREQVTHVLTWPAAAQALADQPRFGSTDLSSLLGGSLFERIPAELRPPEIGLVCNSLGMTETCGLHSFYTAKQEREGVPIEYRGAYGRAVPGFEVQIVDPVKGHPLPDGDEGEIIVRGYALMLGMQKVERSDTFDADGWYHTSDHGFLRDGWLFFTGRRSEMIKTGGSNVAPAEVEHCLRGCRGIMQAFVVGIPHPTSGQRVVALVVPWASERGAFGPIDPNEILVQLKDQLSSFKIPKQLFVISEDDVPWLPSQKPDRRALMALAVRLARAGELDLR